MKSNICAKFDLKEKTVYFQSIRVRSFFFAPSLMSQQGLPGKKSAQVETVEA